MKHLLLALVHMGAEPTAGGPRFTFSLFVSFTRGVQGAWTVCLPRRAFWELALLSSSRMALAAGLLSSYCGLRVAPSAQLLHCSSALTQIVHLLPKSQGQGLYNKQKNWATSWKLVYFSHQLRDKLVPWGAIRSTVNSEVSKFILPVHQTVIFKEGNSYTAQTRKWQLLLNNIHPPSL